MIIDEIVLAAYRLITLFVLGATLWSAWEEEDGYFQITAALLVMPLALRVLMIK
jgi:hypothetical protein